MPKYNVFENYIDKNIRNKHDVLMAQTQIIFEASNILNEAMSSSSMTQKELSKFLGISKGYASRLLSGTENVSLKNLSKILFLLGYELVLSINEINQQQNSENILWADFGKSDSQVQIECSVSESSSPWSEVI